MNEIYNKITNFIEKHGELDQQTNTYYLDIENGVVCFDIIEGSIKVIQTIKCDLLSGETRFLHPIKTYYKNWETPYCLKPDLKKLLN